MLYDKNLNLEEKEICEKYKDLIVMIEKGQILFDELHDDIKRELKEKHGLTDKFIEK
jgi:ABC-type phosphate/phosphonate transport system ATPase subunit